jgi:diaminopimelate decarboxylase
MTNMPSARISAPCKRAFAWAPRFREQFAVKALPNPRIIQVLHEEGAGTDCSSKAELMLSDIAGVKGEEILLTSNDTPADEFQKAIELGAIINLDDISHLDYLEETCRTAESALLPLQPGRPD